MYQSHHIKKLLYDDDDEFLSFLLHIVIYKNGYASKFAKPLLQAIFWSLNNTSYLVTGFFD